MTLSIIQVISEDLTVVKQNNEIFTTVQHDSLKIWANKNNFYWYSRQIFGDIETWLRYYRGYNDQQVSDYLEGYSTDNQFVNFIGNLSPETHDDIGLELHHLYGKKEYHPYIASRNVNEETARYFGLESTKNNIIFPFYDFNGQRIGSIFRNVHTNDKTLKYRKLFLKTPPLLWPIKHWQSLQTDDYVFIMEGAWGVMLATQWVKNPRLKCMCMFGVSTPETLLTYLNGLINVWFVGDRDKTGEEMMKRVKKINPNWKRVIPSIYIDEMNEEQMKKFFGKLINE